MARISVHQEAKQVFQTKDPLEMAENAAAKYDQSIDQIIITYLGQTLRVSRTGEVIADNPAFRLSQNEITCILQYLAQCNGLPLRNSWISFLELPDGVHHFVPFQKEAMEPLAKRFGANLTAFKEIAETLGGKSLAMGDTGYAVQVLPKLPLAIAIWEADEEFPAKANVLFDGAAANCLSTAALWVLGIEVVSRITREDRLGYLGKQ